jgi:hypothetical protein
MDKEHLIFIFFVFNLIFYGINIIGNRLLKNMLNDMLNILKEYRNG